MTYKHIKFKDSEVMRSLERIAVKKGHFDPTPEELVQAAAYKVKNNNFVPTENLYNDLMRLARGLRDKGMESNALEIEKNAFIFKTAETHLYRVHEEDGEDIINFAHPDGNVRMFDAQQGLGEIETLLTRHDRMLEVAKKQPSAVAAPKQVSHQSVEQEVDETSDDGAIDESLAVVAAMIKGAQERTLSEQTRDINQKKINDSFSVLKNEIQLMKETFAKNIPKYSAQMSGELDKISATFNVDIGFGTDSYKKAINIINQSVSKIKALFGSTTDTLNYQQINAPGDTQGQIAFQLLPSLGNEYERIAHDEITKIYGLIPGRVGQKVTDAQNPANIEKLGKAKEFYEYAYKLWDYALRQYQSVGDEKNTAIAAKNLEESKSLFDAMSIAIERNVSLFDLASALKDKVTFSNEDGIIEHARKWALDSEHFAKSTGGLKQSSANEPLKKSLADISIVPTTDKPPTRPASIDKPTAIPVSTQAPLAPHTQIPSVQHVERPTKEEMQAVAMMQQQMSEFALGLNEQADTLAQSLNSNPDELKHYALQIRDTGIGTANPFDGEWGGKTIKSLDIINVIANRAKTSVVDQGENYLKLKPEEVIQKAKANQLAIAELMQKLQLSKYMKTVPAGVSKYPYFDRVPTVLTKETIRTPEETESNVPVKPDTFNSLTDFYLFLEGLGISVSASVTDKLVSLAQGIKQNDPRLLNYWAKQQGQSQQGSNITVKQYDDALRWFYERSLHQEDALRSGKNPEELQRKQTYNNAIRKLWSSWVQSPLRKQSPTSVINRMDLEPLEDTLPGHGSRPQGMGQNVSYRPGGGINEGVTIGDKDPKFEAIQSPPFTNSSGSPKIIIDLVEMASKWAPASVQWYTSYMENYTLDKRKWLGGNADVLYPEYANDGFYFAQEHPGDRGASAGVPEISQKWMASHPGQKLPQYIWFYDICEHIKRNLPVIFRNWKTYLDSMQDEKMARQLEHLVEQNQYELGQWIEIINGQETIIQRMMSRYAA